MLGTDELVWNVRRQGRSTVILVGEKKGKWMKKGRTRFYRTHHARSANKYNTCAATGGRAGPWPPLQKFVEVDTVGV
jgi:hypothetical protein